MISAGINGTKKLIKRMPQKHAKFAAYLCNTNLRNFKRYMLHFLIKVNEQCTCKYKIPCSKQDIDSLIKKNKFSYAKMVYDCTVFFKQEPLPAPVLEQDWHS